MKKKLIFILTFLIMLVLLPSCDKQSVSLKEGATINLTVDSEASNIEVSANFGEVSKINELNYEISVPFKKEFNISVSAPGYITNNYFVKVKDLESGVFNKTIALVEKERKNFSYTLNTKYEEFKCFNSKGEVIGELENSVYSFVLTKEEAQSGFTFKAKGMEDYKVNLTEKELNSTYINSSLVLTPKGTKLISFSSRQNVFATLASGEFLPLNSMRIGDYSAPITYFFSVNNDFVGKVNINEVYGGEPETINIDNNTPVYGSKFEIGNNDNDYIDNNVIIKNCEKWSCRNVYYVNEQKELKMAFINEQTNQEGNIQFSLIVPNNSKLFFFDYDNNPCYEYFYTKGSSIDFNDFNDIRNQKINKCQVFDLFNEEIIDGTIVEINKMGESIEHQSVDGIFIFDNINNSLSFKDSLDGEIRFNQYNKTYVYVNDELIYRFDVSLNYKIKFKTLLDGKPTEFDEVMLDRMIVNKNNEGFYEKNIYYKNVNFSAKLNEVNYNAKIDFDERKFDANTRTYTLDVNFKSMIGVRVCFNFRQEGDIRISIMSIASNNENLVFHRLSGSDNYYLFAPINTNEKLTITYRESIYTPNRIHESIKTLEYNFNLQELFQNNSDMIYVELNSYDGNNDKYK